jgi:hypothetical protein
MRLSFQTGLAGAYRRRPGMFFLGHCLLRDGLRNCLFSMPFHRGLPPSRHIRRSSVVTGDPGRRQRRCAPMLLTRSACAGTAAVRTAKPVPVASSCSPMSFPQDERALLHAATELQGRRLDTGPSSCWWFQGKPSGAVQAGRSGNCLP